MRQTNMRWLITAIAILVAAPSAADNGYYVTEAFGGGAYQGELGRYGGGAPRFYIGGGIRRGERSYELFGSFSVPELYEIDCYGAECAYAARPEASLGGIGFEVRQRWRVLHLRRFGKPGVYERPGLFFALHGGLRWFWAGDALADYQGPGVGGGASIEGDLWVLGYFLDAGIDVLHLRGPGPTVHGSTPYLMVGARFGWL